MNMNEFLSTMKTHSQQAQSKRLKVFQMPFQHNITKYYSPYEYRTKLLAFESSS